MVLIKIFSILIWLIFPTVIEGHDLPYKFGKCLVPKPIENFDANQFFSERWYKQKGFGSLLQDMTGICPTVQYQIRDDQIISLDYQFNEMLQRYLTQSGHGSLSSMSKNVGHLVYYFNLINNLSEVDFNMYIIHTDYEDYAIVYYCRPTFLLFKEEAAWIMARSRSGVNGTEDKIKQIINNNGLNYDDFKPEINVGCGLDEPSL